MSYESQRARLKRSLLRHEGPFCAYCHEVVWPEKLTIDHIVPRCAGEDNRLKNVVLACEPCNKKKGANFSTGGRWAKLGDFFNGLLNA